MGTVISIIQEKGGVGKSLATMNIAYYLTETHRVLIIDLDGQAANLSYYMLGNAAAEQKTIMDVFQGRAEIEEIITPVNLNLDIIPANVDVANISQNNKISTFKNIINKLKEMYNYIFIDVTPSPNWTHLLALCADGQKIIPIINADASSLKALISLNESVQEVRETINPSAEYLGVIINRYNGRTNLSKEIVTKAGDIAKKMGTALFSTKIRQSTTLSEQPISHSSIFDYAPNSTAARDYRALAEEIVERLEK